MSNTLKKRFAAIVAAFLLVFTSMVTVCGLKTDKADALSASTNEFETIYYFTDSEPTFAEHNPAPVYYDMHKCISEQEFEFMVYGGYFWCLNDHTAPIVIIQLATIKPSEEVLNVLFGCLEARGIEAMFLSPYIYEYGNLGCFSTIMCPLDDYDLFLRNSVDAMYHGLETEDFTTEYDPDKTHGSGRPEHDGNSLPNNTTLFLDGRLIDINEYSANLDIRQCYMNSSVFRRLLCYLRYGYDCDYNPIEEGIYNYLWRVYCDEILVHFGSSEDFYDKPNAANSYIAIWRTMDEMDPDFLSDFWYAYSHCDYGYQQGIGEFCDSYFDIVGEYYSSYMDYFNGKNIQIYAHADDIQYYSLFKMKDDNGESYICQNYLFATYADYLSLDIRPIDYIYAMGITFLKPDFYSFLHLFQQLIKALADDEDIEGFTFDIENINAQSVTIFVWVDEPYPYDPDGLQYVTAEGLMDYFDNGEDENGYDYNRWLQEYLEQLRTLLYLIHNRP